jgi:poly-gamma-glutamate capsule biosynthesis protein CapA/YwtB (metallophosphatase superfamily)
VTGSHPHVVQALDYWRGRPIAYSLGNAVNPKALSRLASGAWLELRISPRGEVESAALKPIPR